MNYKERMSISRTIGRVILVGFAVFAALTAYQWDKDRVNHLEAIEALKMLKNEVDISREVLESSVKAHIKIKETSVKLLDILHKDEAPDVAELDRMDFLVRRTYNLKYSQAAIEALIPKCRLFDLGNDSLRRKIMAYPDYLNQYRSKENVAQEFYNEEFLPYLIETIPMSKEADDKSKLALYRSMEYQNFVKQKMEFTIEVLFEGQVMKNYADELSASIEKSIVRLAND